MDRLRQLFTLAGLWAMVACNGVPPHQQKLSDLDSMQEQVEAYQQLLDSLNSEEVVQLTRHVDTQWTYVLNNYPDSSDRDFWLKEVAYFGQIHKDLQRLSKGKGELREELVYTEKQLESLENSIEDEKLTGKEVEEYFEDEVQAFQQLSFTARKTLRGARQSLVLWEELGPQYDSIASRIRSRP